MSPRLPERIVDIELDTHVDKSPDFVAYHKSINSELEALKDRVRNLIGHRPTDGAYKESILRSILRRHLSENLHIGTGFVVTSEKCSTQIDILIVDKPDLACFRMVIS